MGDRNPLHWFFNPFVIFGAILFAGALFAFSLILLMLTRSPAGAQSPATAVMSVIAAPSPTQLFTAPTLQATQVPTQAVAGPTPTPGNLAVGEYVQVSGTGGDGLRMRSEAGLKGEVVFVGLEAEVFKVSDGPRQADGYTWWYLVDPYDSKHSGWAASNYLTAIQNPN